MRDTRYLRTELAESPGRSSIPRRPARTVAQRNLIRGVSAPAEWLGADHLCNGIERPIRYPNRYPRGRGTHVVPTWSTLTLEAMAVAAFQAVNAKLLAQAWPTTDRADIHALVAAAAAVSGDLSGLLSLDLVNESSWVTQLSHDTSRTCRRQHGTLRPRVAATTQLAGRPDGTPRAHEVRSVAVKRGPASA